MRPSRALVPTDYLGGIKARSHAGESVMGRFDSEIDSGVRLFDKASNIWTLFVWGPAVVFAAFIFAGQWWNPIDRQAGFWALVGALIVAPFGFGLVNRALNGKRLVNRIVNGAVGFAFCSLAGWILFEGSAFHHPDTDRQRALEAWKVEEAFLRQKERDDLRRLANDRSLLASEYLRIHGEYPDDRTLRDDPGMLATWLSIALRVEGLNKRGRCIWLDYKGTDDWCPEVEFPFFLGSCDQVGKNHYFCCDHGGFPTWDYTGKSLVCDANLTGPAPKRSRVKK